MAEGKLRLDQADPTLLSAGETEIVLRPPGLRAPGRCVIGIWLGDASKTFQGHEAIAFDVLPRPGDQTDNRQRILQPPIEWEAGTGCPGF